MVQHSQFINNNNVLSSVLCGAILVRNGINLLINAEFTNYPNSFLCLYDSQNINISNTQFIDSNANDAGIFVYKQFHSNSHIRINFESGVIYAIGEQTNINILHSKLNLINDEAVSLECRNYKHFL